MKREFLKGFTLVELIIVITILIILGSISFLSFQGYTKNSRDSTRLASLKNISTGLNVYKIKSNKYPDPDEAITFSGNSSINLKQGKLGENVGRLISLIDDYKDPKTGENLNYSITSDGKFFQLGTNLENNTISYFLNQVYADNYFVKLEGNYKFDPVLPSLFVVNGTANSNGIFDKNVCFIDEKSNNNFNSTSENCIKKVDLNLKNIDNSLIGYWDMETTFNSGGTNYLKDLSGNGNNGIFSGTTMPVQTGGLMGSGFYFGSGGTSGSFFIIPNSLSLNNPEKNRQLTISSIFKLDDSFKNLSFTTFILKGSNFVTNDCSIAGCTNRQFGVYVVSTGGLQGIVVSKNSYENDLAQSSVYSNSNYLESNKYYMTTLVIDFDKQELGIYLNGQKQNSTKLDSSGISNNTGELFIGNFRTRWVPATYGSKYIDDLKFYNRALSDQEILQQAKIAGF